jgi:hypothetical protein
MRPAAGALRFRLPFRTAGADSMAGSTGGRDKPTGSSETMNSADPRSKNTAAKVQKGNTTANPGAKVPSDLYPNPPGVSDKEPGAPDD